MPVVVWRDAANTLVGPGVFGDEGALYFDARGLIWSLDPLTGALSPRPEPLQVRYDAVDCMGNAYVEATMARLVFWVVNEPENTFRAIPDTRSPVKVRLRSTREGTSCRNRDTELDVVLLADTLPAMPIVKPAVSFVAPLHLSRE